MPRVIAIHRITLKEGVTPEQFEAFARKEWKPWDLPGWRFSLAKGDRGRDVGTFFQIFEADVATRDRDFPPPSGRLTDEARARLERASSSPEQKRSDERWAALAVQPTDLDRIYTDYVVIVE